MHFENLGSADGSLAMIEKAASVEEGRNRLEVSAAARGMASLWYCEILITRLETIVNGEVTRCAFRL